jgi:hypothetical protein
MILKNDYIFYHHPILDSLQNDPEILHSLNGENEDYMIFWLADKQQS